MYLLCCKGESGTLGGFYGGRLQRYMVYNLDLGHDTSQEWLMLEVVNIIDEDLQG